MPSVSSPPKRVPGRTRISPAWMAAQMGVSRRTVQYWLSGVTTPHRFLRARWSKVRRGIAVQP